MFEKKTYIYSEALGVCRVDDITSLAQKKSDPVAYYVLRSFFQKDKVAYIPVDHHSVLLRELITLEVAQQKKDEWIAQGLIQIETSEEEEEETRVGSIDWEIQYRMADTLPEDERRFLYEKGEVEFILEDLEPKKNKK